MSTPVIPDIRIQQDDFDLTTEIERLTRGHGDIGAVVTFSGLCRSDGGTLAALELEHYPGMAEAEMTRIAQEALRRWPLNGLCAIHRYGRIRPGENIVLVLAASAHRQAAFDAASFMMDFLKTRAPFWKREHPVDGAPGGWVEARDADSAAETRWKNLTQR